MHNYLCNKYSHYMVNISVIHRKLPYPHPSHLPTLNKQHSLVNKLICANGQTCKSTCVLHLYKSGRCFSFAFFMTSSRNAEYVRTTLSIFTCQQARYSFCANGWPYKSGYFLHLYKPSYVCHLRLFLMSFSRIINYTKCYIRNIHILQAHNSYIRAYY